MRNSIEQVDVGLLPHAAKDLAAREYRPDRIAVRPRVRGQYKTIPPADLIEYLLQHRPGLLLFLGLLASLVDPRQQFVNSPLHRLRPVERPQKIRNVAQ